MVANNLKSKRGSSVEKCATIGLFNLMYQVSDSTFKGFQNAVEPEYKKAIAPQLSKWEIAFSILTLGVLTVIYAIVALVKRKLTKDVIKN
ncbi:MAG: hypothetical protein QRY74_03460 [Chlamydia sp.]